MSKVDTKAPLVIEKKAEVKTLNPVKAPSAGVNSA